MTSDAVKRGIAAAIAADGAARADAVRHADAVLAWLARAGLSIAGTPDPNSVAEAEEHARVAQGRYLRPRR